MQFDAIYSLRGVLESSDSAQRVQVPNMSAFWPQKTIPSMVFGTRVLEHGVLGPSRLVVCRNKRAGDNDTPRVSGAQSKDHINRRIQKTRAWFLESPLSWQPWSQTVGS